VAGLVDSLADALGGEFASYADPVRAAGARAYMRDQFPFYGIPAPQQRSIARTVTQGLDPPTQSELVGVAQLCWDRDERAWQYFACWYLRRHVPGRPPSLLASVGSLITTKSWWDTVDSLAAHAVGTLVAEHAELASSMDAWIGSENLWLARTALIHQLAYKTSTDADRLFRYCLLRASDRDFFIRKAIGWALREYSKTDARAVRQFVVDHADALAPLSRREALKWLSRRA